MPRYEARCDEAEGGPGNNDCWTVNDTHEHGIELGGGRYLADWEAEAMVFALNAVHDNLSLEAWAPTERGDECVRSYTKPS